MLDGSITMPDVYLLDHQTRESMNPEFYHWLRIDQTIRSWLFATLSEDMLVEVHDVKFSTLIWQRFQSRFMNASLARSIVLKRVLQHVSKTESQSMDTYTRNQTHC